MQASDNAQRHPWITPDWPAPARVRACATTRADGVSDGVYRGLNLSSYVGDDAQAVAANRARLRQRLALPAEPRWLDQVHGTGILCASPTPAGGRLEFDGSQTMLPGVVCTVQTADCLPVLLTDQAGAQVAALHAGWRGLAAGILEQGVAAMQAPPTQVLAWLGPAIGPAAFEVGADVVQVFTADDAGAAAAFVARGERWLADIYLLARRRLQAAGVTAVYGGGFCTYNDAARFYSYRRDRVTGRMATLIWISDDLQNNHSP